MRPRALPRHAVIVGSVVLFHVAALWSLQSGLLRRVVEVVVPVQLLSEIKAPVVPPPAAVPPPPPKPRAEPPRPSAAAPRPAPSRPAPQPVALAVDNSPPAPSAPTGVLTPQPPLASVTAPVNPSPVSSPAKPVKVELPSSDADYLNNPKPIYPMLSKRMGEQGQVLVRVLIGADGLPQKADIKTSSGFDRLDQAALATVLKWRYVPGKRAGTAEAMWFNVPLNFVLE